MGFLSAYVGGGKKTKYLIACRVASLITSAKHDLGMSALATGSIILFSDLEVAFSGDGGSGKLAVQRSRDRCASVPLGQFFKEGEIADLDSCTFNTDAVIDRVTYEVISEFEKKSQGFADLGKLFKPIGEYVFFGKSRQFLDAEKLGDILEMANLLRKRGEVHCLFETYENYGGAKIREREMKAFFVGGLVCSFELPMGGG
jgi:hypothetical protein